MTTEVLAQTVVAGTPAFFGQGRIWYLKTATGPVTITARKSGGGSTNVRKFINVAAGFKFRAEIGDGWDILQMDSVSSQAIEIIVGDDDVEVANAVSITGSATTIEAPFATPVTPADAVILTGGNAVIAANLARRAITIGSLASNAPATTNLRVGTAASARGYELQPGTWQRIPTTGALTIFNGDANSQTYWIFEET